MVFPFFGLINLFTYLNCECRIIILLSDLFESLLFTFCKGLNGSSCVFLQYGVKRARETRRSNVIRLGFSENYLNQAPFWLPQIDFIFG